MNEQEMRNSEVPWLKSIEELSKYIDDLAKQEHDYGTCVYAMSMAATATFNYVAGVLGVTGFQASCADMDILRRTRGLKYGFQLIDYDHIFYPQYLNDEHFPSYRDIIAKNRIYFAKIAKEKITEIEEDFPPHAEVLNHWKYLASLATDEEIEKEFNKEKS